MLPTSSVSATSGLLNPKTKLKPKKYKTGANNRRYVFEKNKEKFSLFK
jgi:hypothetical protein